MATCEEAQCEPILQGRLARPSPETVRVWGVSEPRSAGLRCTARSGLCAGGEPHAEG